MRRIDAHTHFYADRPGGVEFLERLDLKVLNVCVVEEAQAPWPTQADTYARLAEENPGRFAWCTTFDLADVGGPGYADRAIAALDRDFARGAIGCKGWKNIGMKLRGPDGRYLLIDDPAFGAIFEHLQNADKTFLLHTADPAVFWQEAGRTDGYLRNYPQWYMYDKPGAPSHEQLMAARTHLLERYPKLRLVGAHLGSQENDFAALARDLDRYPNYALDIGGRTPELMQMDWRTVRQFIVDYQDRILFSTDTGPMDKAHSEFSDAEFEAFLKQAAEDYQLCFDYYQTDRTVSFGGFESRGLALDEAVLRKLYRTNAERWFPGL